MADIAITNNGNANIGLGSQQGAEFYITIAGTFSVFAITLNGKTLTYTENCVGQTITIDNVKGTVKNGTVNKMSKVTGDVADFLTLIPGANTITCTKTGSSTTFTVYYRELYI